MPIALTRRRALELALLAASAAFLVGVTLLPDLALAQEKAPEVVRIGSTAPGHMKFVLFRRQKLLEEAFKDEGTKFEFVTFDGGSAASVALGSGQLDLMYTGNNPALRLAASGADVHAIGLSSWVPNNETQVVVRPDSDIQGLADLKGRKVAYLTGTVRHSIFSKALQSVGLTIADVDSYNFGIENSGPALARGDIDAIVESSGVAQKLVDAGGARKVFDAAGHPEWAVPYIITANGDFLAKYPESVAKILAEDIRLARWVDEHPEETIAGFVAETGNSEASVRETYAAGKFYQNPEITAAAVDALKGEEAFMKEAGLIKGAVDYDTWIDEAAFERARLLVEPQSN